MYETLGRELQQLTSERFVSPHGDKRKAEIVRLISPEDAKKMIGLAKKGAVACRPIILGVCSSREPCPYGGIDNIARCGVVIQWMQNLALMCCMTQNDWVR
jgi:hypothetical protein